MSYFVREKNQFVNLLLSPKVLLTKIVKIIHWLEIFCCCFCVQLVENAGEHYVNGQKFLCVFRRNVKTKQFKEQKCCYSLTHLTFYYVNLLTIAKDVYFFNWKFPFFLNQKHATMQIILNLIKHLARTEFLIGQPQPAIVFHRKNQQKKTRYMVHSMFNKKIVFVQNFDYCVKGVENSALVLGSLRCFEISNILFFHASQPIT